VGFEEESRCSCRLDLNDPPISIGGIQARASMKLAIERVETKKHQLRLTKDQPEQLKERRRTEEAAAESAFRELYTAVWLPRVEVGEIVIDPIEKGGRPLQATGIHERVMEMLTSQGAPKVHSSVTPRKIIERLKLGESVVEDQLPKSGIGISEIVEAFYRDIEPPRLDSVAALRKAIARGVAEGTFGYTSGMVPTLGPDGKFQIYRERIVMNRPVAEDEVDLDSGFIMLPQAVPEAIPAALTPGAHKIAEPPGAPSPITPSGPPVSPVPQTPSRQVQHVVKLLLTATRDQVFKAFPAIANLADMSDEGKVQISVEGTSEVGYDPSRLRNAVEEPLDEADLELKITKE
jgi:hypothetical protein